MHTDNETVRRNRYILSCKSSETAMIDTLAIAENLAAAGIEQEQAKAIANAVAQQHGETATKDFVRSEISNVRTEIKASEVRLVRWIFAAVGLLFAALRFIP